MFDNKMNGSAEILPSCSTSASFAATRARKITINNQPDAFALTEDQLKDQNLKSCRVHTLRISVFLALSLAAALLGYFAFTLFSKAEQDSFERQFSSSASLIADNLKAAFQIIFNSALEQSALYTYQFQDESIWPNVTIVGFNEVSTVRLQISNGHGINFIPLIDARTNRKSWEAYAAATYPSLELPQDVRDVLAAWPPSKGIYDTPGNGTYKVYSTTPIVGSLYPYILAPTWQVSPAENNIIIMKNQHSSGPRLVTIDQCIETLQPALSDFLKLYTDPTASLRPSAIMYVPILSYTNRSKVLGITNLVFTWDTLMSGALPSFIKGVECVIHSSTSGSSYTFSVDGQTVNAESASDTHDPSYNYLRYQFNIHVDPAQVYTVSVYPTKGLENLYKTDTPLVSLLAVICGIGILLIFLFRLIL